MPPAPRAPEPPLQAARTGASRRTGRQDGSADDHAAVEDLLELTRFLVSLAAQSLEAAAPTLSLAQFRALRVLDRLGPCTGGGLAEQLGTHASTVTRLCDRLVATGHITRELRPDNRREVALEVTAQGRALVRAVEAHRADQLTRLLQALAPERRRELASGLAALVEAVGAEHGEVPEGWVH